MKSNATEITRDELCRMLEAGKPLFLLDVRTAGERAEWFIPGSVHFDAAAALKSRDIAPFAALSLPADRPVVTICSQGNSSLVARELLAGSGLKAWSLAGGMKGWSLAWNRAEVPVAGRSDVRVVQLRRTGKGCLSYLVGSGGQAAVIDPSLQPEVYLKVAADNGWTISTVIDTHIHADHLSRARRLSEMTGAPIRLPETTRVTYPYKPVRDSDAIEVGRVVLMVMRTPGHTPESACYRLDNQLLFTGDTLFVDSVGRPDLAATTREAEHRAHALWRSLEHLKLLPAGLLVLPGHTGRPIPFDGRPIAAPLSAVREAVGALPQEEKLFVADILQGLPPAPANHAAIVKLNEKGQFPDGDPTDLEAGANRCAVR